ncbi:MAG TPA: YihY/virulence factor BrkB family protein [Acidimicrobiales bacterium]|nr:YihY/virulence factor BrkB family protein [Acidimicrobiales bacterium]
MGRIRRLLAAVDGWQQRHAWAAFPLAVVNKFGRDRGGSLAALIAYYGFLSLFPLLLVAITVLGYVLAGHPALQASVETSILGRFPVIGDQLHANVNHPLTGHPLGLAVGVAGLLWGSLGVTQAGQYAMAQVWDVPDEMRPGLLARLGRGGAFLGVLAMSAVVTTGLSGLASFDSGVPAAAAVAGPVLATAANVGLYLLGFRVLTPAGVPTRQLWPGALVGGLGWEVLQVAGGYLVGHQLQHASAVYGLFGLVLGLISWIYLGAQLSLYSAEVNVVAAKRLWPRHLVQPDKAPTA